MSIVSGVEMSVAAIDYNAFLASGPTADLAGTREFLIQELPYVWLDVYIAMRPHQQNVHRIEIEGFEYLWDFSSELVAQGVLRPSEAVDDRLIAAHGVSRVATEPREDSRLRGRTLGPVEVVDASHRLPYDRGHTIDHVLGGGLDINIIPQSRAMNRGGTWRRMERYCRDHPGTYFFCRPIYQGLCSHPAEIEFGILKPDRSIWVNTFRNYGRTEELEEFERLYREKIAAIGQPSDLGTGGGSRNSQLPRLPGSTKEDSVACPRRRGRNGTIFKPE
jgi:hypothetical protein